MTPKMGYVNGGAIRSLRDQIEQIFNRQITPVSLGARVRTSAGSFESNGLYYM